MKKVLFMLGFLCLLFCFADGILGAEEGDSSSSSTQQPAVSPKSPYTYRELKALQEQLELIKERLVQYRARLLELKDQLALTKMAVINASLKYHDEVGGTFDLVEVHFYLDGFEIYKAPGADVRKAKEIPIYQGSLLPGEHLLSAELLYSGKGYGVFSYMKKNVYRVRSRYTFSVDEGEEVELNIVSLDKGSLMGSVGERLKLEYKINKKSITAEGEMPEAGAGNQGVDEGKDKKNKDDKKKKVR